MPDDVVFQTKPQIALDLIDRAKANGVEVIAWTADELYGRDGAFLDGLDGRGTVGKQFREYTLIKKNN